MLYFYYLLSRTTVTRTIASTLRLLKTLQGLELTFRELNFTGEDQILIIYFLTRLVKEADTLYISEGQTLLLLTHLLRNYDAKQCRASTNGSRTGTSGGIVHWSDAVQYLLRTYAAETAISEAIDDFR